MRLAQRKVRNAALIVAAAGIVLVAPACGAGDSNPKVPPVTAGVTAPGGGPTTIPATTNP